jgi:hypothetical protein
MSKSKKYNKRGGFWNQASRGGTNVIDSISDGADNAGTGIQNFFSSGYDKLFNKKPSSTTSSSTGLSTTGLSSSTTGLSSTGSTTGGGRKKRGGTMGYTSLTNIASTASPVKGMYTAKAHNWVGGKTRRRRRKKRSNRRR